MIFVMFFFQTLHHGVGCRASCYKAGWGCLPSLLQSTSWFFKSTGSDKAKMSLRLSKCLLCMFLVSRRVWACHWTRISCQIWYCLGYFAYKVNLCQMSSSSAGSLISCCLIQNVTSNPACIACAWNLYLYLVCHLFWDIIPFSGWKEQANGAWTTVWSFTGDSNCTLVIHITPGSIMSCGILEAVVVTISYFPPTISNLDSLKGFSNPAVLVFL
jgi:hypothetical protein